MIDIDNFTPLTALVGGGLIGLAAAILYAFNGRVLGASGITASALEGVIHPAAREGLSWRVAFLVGVIIGPAVYMLMTGALPQSEYIAQDGRLVIAGLIVGLGTGLGSGCTSGHGICGLARFSKRSLAAVITFMATGFLTAFVINHLIGL
ncbi:MAG: YeeE/YedE family protein [Rhizobiales bacterium TMED249]|uniref:YeeE/YedE family protein n=1 Tax=PS1 clade bacterium TaxID=2175152 RepID=A0A368DT15_9PROT|nr:MAG: YeeE/YedE family protein [Rhizobiales bacterium TMED249]RCL74977.1 MAG: YeeE/YedE family protein [PS1 clade bacterium]HAK98833.1 YeeE/YedE family protein [Rhodobiaceae bacterium]|tara:strand:+ start:1550 stop:1999 length:450 start_codon:yes stop_codon:yes gene_type:complete